MFNMPDAPGRPRKGAPVIDADRAGRAVLASTAQGKPWHRHASGRPVGVGPTPSQGWGHDQEWAGPLCRAWGLTQRNHTHNPYQQRRELLASYLCRSLRGVLRQCCLAKCLIYLAPRAGPPEVSDFSRLDRQTCLCVASVAKGTFPALSNLQPFPRNELRRKLWRL